MSSRLARSDPLRPFVPRAPAPAGTLRATLPTALGNGMPKRKTTRRHLSASSHKHQSSLRLTARRLSRRQQRVEKGNNLCRSRHSERRQHDPPASTAAGTAYSRGGHVHPPLRSPASFRWATSDPTTTTSNKATNEPTHGSIISHAAQSPAHIIRDIQLIKRLPVLTASSYTHVPHPTKLPNNDYDQGELIEMTTCGAKKEAPNISAKKNC